jgi:DHA1 family bicyclomycin/chloramphenicol resistance-like MFS transporter
LPALPTLEVEYAVDAARVQHTLSAYLLGMALGQLLFGPLTDRYGRKRPLLVGLLAFSVASVGCAMAQDIGSFVLLRFLQALGGSSGMVVIRAVIRDRFDAMQSARVLSLMMLVMGVAPILAPLAGGWLLVHGGWHWIFWLLAAFAILCIGLVATFLDESHPAHKRNASLGGAVAGVLPVIRDRRFLGPAIVFMASFGSFFAYLAAAPFVYIQYFGVPADEFGMYFGAGAVGFISISQVNRRLISGRGPRVVLGWGVNLLGAAALILAVCSATGIGGFAGVFGSILLIVASLGLIASNASAVAMAPFGSAAGGAASLLGATQSLTGMLASAAVGIVPAHGPIPMATVIGACAAISLLAYALLVRKERNAP